MVEWLIDEWMNWWLINSLLNELINGWLVNRWMDDLWIMNGWIAKWMINKCINDASWLLLSLLLLIIVTLKHDSVVYTLVHKWLIWDVARTCVGLRYFLQAVTWAITLAWLSLLTLMPLTLIMHWPGCRPATAATVPAKQTK